MEVNAPAECPGQLLTACQGPMAARPGPTPAVEKARRGGAALLAAAFLLLLWSYRRAPGRGKIHRIAFCLKLAGVLLVALCLVEPLWSGRRAKSDAKRVFRFSLRPEKTGVLFYHVRVSQMSKDESSDQAETPAEATLSNNDRTVVVDRGKGPYRILYVAGHNYFTFNDPYFRIILLLAMAWAMNESFDPFKPLVTKGIKLSL